MFDWASDPQFWVGLLQIIWIDIILSGDNAVVIALACRRLPPRQQRVAILAGTGAAIALRVTMATVVTLLLEISFLKLVGSVLLLWIAIKLLAPQDEKSGNGESISNLWQAVRTIVIADFVMSLDNVIGIAAAQDDVNPDDLQQPCPKLRVHCPIKHRHSHTVLSKTRIIPG